MSLFCWRTECVPVGGVASAPRNCVRLVGGQECPCCWNDCV